MSALMPAILNAKKGSFPCLLASILITVFSFTGPLNAQRNDGRFVVVLDAGHGGHDPGNLGNGYLEKNIALNIVLNAGAILERTPGIEVIYTRKDDTFVDLYVRGEIANKANADLFVSVHCDSHTSNAHGAGTFVLGLHANKQNFEIAKKENSVIYLEDNYESRYADYDINSPESVIGLTIMQEEFLDQSISLAKSIQNNFSNKLKRKDREVKQAGFIVLHQTFMPSVLVETGFLTNDNEGAYLNSNRGQADMGKAIAEAIIGYRGGVRSGSSQVSTMVNSQTPDAKEEMTVAKEALASSNDAAEQFAKNPGVNPIAEKAIEETSTSEEIVEAVAQEAASSPAKAVTEIPKKTEVATEVAKEEVREMISETEESPIEQEVILASREAKPPAAIQKEATKPKEEIIKEEIKKEQVVTSDPPKGNDKNIIFKVQLVASTTEIPLQPSNFKGLNKLSKERFKQYHRYMYGSTDSYAQAKLLKSNADAKGYSTSYIVAYKDGIRIPTPEAIKLVSE
jgi:N-acetylmuramoyl-L-alanine amidase